MGRIVAWGAGSAAAWGCRDAPAPKGRVLGKCGSLRTSTRPCRGGLGERLTRERDGKETGELRPPRPLPGTEVPGTEAPRGAYITSPKLPRNRPAWGPQGPPPSEGRTWDVTFGTSASYSERTDCSRARLPEIFVVPKISFFLTLALTCLPTWLSAAPTSPCPHRSPICGAVIYIRKRLCPGREPSSACLRVWVGGGAGLGPSRSHSGLNCFSNALDFRIGSPGHGLQLDLRRGDGLERGWGWWGWGVQCCEAMTENCSITSLKFLCFSGNVFLEKSLDIVMWWGNLLILPFWGS